MSAGVVLYVALVVTLAAVSGWADGGTESPARPADALGVARGVGGVATVVVVRRSPAPMAPHAELAMTRVRVPGGEYRLLRREWSLLERSGAAIISLAAHRSRPRWTQRCAPVPARVAIVRRERVAARVVPRWRCSHWCTCAFGAHGASGLRRNCSARACASRRDTDRR